MQPLYDLTTYPVQGPMRGKTLLIMGMSADGPVNIPIPVTSLDSAKKIFGEEGSLYKAYERAYLVDSTILIYLMRVTGEHATCTLWGRDIEDYESDLQPILNLKSLSGGAAYNGMEISIQEDVTNNNDFLLMFTFPPHTGLDAITYRLDDYDNINMLVKAINEDSNSRNSCIHASSTYLDYSTRSIVAYNDIETFEGGEDGLTATKNDLFLALEYSYSLLEGYYIDYIVPVDARFDDTHPAAFYGDAIYGTNWYDDTRDYLSLQDMEDEGKLVTFYKQLIDFCKKQIALGCMTHGIIGLNLVKDPTDIGKYEYSYVVKLAETSGFRTRYGLSTFANGEWSDSGYYISVTTGEQFYHKDTESEYYENLAVTYAAMLTSLSPTGTTTNLPIPNSEGLRYEFEGNELMELSALGVVAPRNSVRKGIVIANGVTAGLASNDMHSIANVRQVQLALSFLNEAIDDYIGQPILPLIQRGVLQKVVKNVLDSLKEDGLLIDYNYNLEYDESRGLGTLSVDLQAKNMVEYVSARAQLGFTL